MSYLHKGDHLYSTVTKKTYPLPPPGTDRDGSQTRAVTKQLLRDNTAVTKAAQARNGGRALDARERITGVVVVPDTRTAREKVQTMTQPGAPHPDANPFASALADAERSYKTAILPQDRAQAARRIETYRAKHDAWQGTRDVQKAAEQVAADPAREAALVHAHAEFDLLRLRGDVGEHHISEARDRLDALTAGTLAPSDYFASAEQAQEQLAAERKAAADALDAQAKELRQAAKAVRSGEPAPAAEQP